MSTLAPQPRKKPTAAREHQDVSFPAFLVCEARNNLSQRCHWIVVIFFCLQSYQKRRAALDSDSVSLCFNASSLCCSAMKSDKKPLGGTTPLKLQRLFCFSQAALGYMFDAVRADGYTIRSIPVVRRSVCCLYKTN